MIDLLKLDIWDAFGPQIFIKTDLDACVTDLRKLDDYEKRELIYEVKTLNHLPTCFLHDLVIDDCN